MTATSPGTSVRTYHEAVQIDSVIPNKLVYLAGDTLTIDFDTSLAGAILSVNFSSLDDGYVSGSETVTDLGGGAYRASYTLSATNTRLPGDYDLSFEFHDSSGSVLESARVPIRYLPDGPMQTHIAGGSYFPEPVPAVTIDPSVILDTITDTGVDATVTAFDPTKPDFSLSHVAPAVHDGRIMQLDFRTQGSEPIERLFADVWESAREGYVRVPLDVAIHIAHAMRDSLDYWGQWIDPYDLHSFNVLYDSLEVVSGTNYSNYAYTVHPAFVHMHPNSGWSNFTVGHESGHYFHVQFMRNSLMDWTWQGFQVLADARFGEPMAQVNGVAITGNKWFIGYRNGVAEDIDYNGTIANNGDQEATAPTMTFYPNLAAAPPPSGGCVQPGWDLERQTDCMMEQNQGFTWRMFYDLHDPASPTAPEPVETFYTDVNDPQTGFTEPDFDEFDGQPASVANYALMDVFLGYLGKSPCNPNYLDRGQLKLDIVDVLDGLVCRGHLTFADADKLLHIVMGYDYDFPNMPACDQVAQSCQ